MAHLRLTIYCFGAPAYPGPGRSRARISELRRCRASGYRVHCYTAGAVRVSFSNCGPSRGWSGKYGRLASSYTSPGDGRCSVPELLHKSCLEGDTSFLWKLFSIPLWTLWACECSSNTIGINSLVECSSSSCYIIAEMWLAPFFKSSTAQISCFGCS